MGVDLDEAALETAKENLIDMELEEEIDLLQAKVTPVDQSSVLEGLVGKFDTVIMSELFALIAALSKTPIDPPFGMAFCMQLKHSSRCSKGRKHPTSIWSSLSGLVR